MRLFDRAMTFFGKESVSKPNEQSLLLPLGGGSIQESGVPAVQKEEGDESISPLNQLLPFDVAVIVYCLLDPKQLAGAQGRAALAAQYTHHLGFDESFLKSQTEAQEKFIGQQKSLERVLSYLLKYHPSLLGGDIQFRDIKLHALTLSNSAVDVAGCYTIDTTGADFLALQAIFKGGMYNARVFFRVAISSCVLMSFLFLSLFFSMKRNLLFCPVDELYFIGSSSGSGSKRCLGLW